ncbi:hypothetical protein FSARC_9041 [Fusarium sarcochroum]|uniref:Uncharacterized protein n=1 Tax=Fusarium sarcochroum TaxID=1208366 RepID=A0A8H4X6A3_9HYPO|nr:hypothetical protein FSARC_9041 [Fusarium sarcochroum]
MVKQPVTSAQAEELRRAIDELDRQATRIMSILWLGLLSGNMTPGGLEILREEMTRLQGEVANFKRQLEALGL